MLARRVMPKLLLDNGSLVISKQFNPWRKVGSPISAIKVFEARAVDEIVLLDIRATREGRGPDLKTIEAVARECFTPLTVGGGVRSLGDIRDLLNAGADKVVIGTAVGLIEPAARKFGAQCVVAAVDVQHGQSARISPWFDHAGEILLTSIDRDGTMTGYDLDLIHQVSQAVSIPVIASGGAGSYDDFDKAFAAGADAVAASTLWQFTDATPTEARSHLAQHGYEVRP